MKNIYSIAGLKVKLSGQQTIQLISALPGFDVFESTYENEEEIDISIYTDVNIYVNSLENISLVHHFRVLDADHTFSTYKEGYLYEIHTLDGHKLVNIIHNRQNNEVFVSSLGCETYVKYAIWVAYCLAAIWKDIIPIHASSIVKDSESVLFLGESGTGKSTHTRLWLQYIEGSYLLNDDSPLLFINDDKIFACGSPWSGKTNFYKQELIPLRAIVRLSQYPENRISHLNNLASIGAIHPSFPPFLAYDKSYSEKIISIIDKIIKNTPIYELKCRPDRCAAEVAYATIY